MTEYQAKLIERYRKAILYVIPNLTYKTENGIDLLFLTEKSINEKLLERWLKINHEINDEYVRCGNELDFEFSNKIDEMLKKIDGS